MSTRFLSIVFVCTAFFLMSFSHLKKTERMNVCKTITHIGKAFSEKDISGLVGESANEVDGVTIYDSKVDVEGLEDEFIADSDEEIVFFATYVNASATKLKAKFNELKNQVSKCLNQTFETSKLESIETATFKYNEDVTVEITIYHDDNEIDLNIDVSKL